MLKFVTLLIVLPREITSIRACVPNTQFFFNGRLCFCDIRGYWDETNCKTISHRQSCQAGQIIWQGCNQCICQENGYLLCSNSQCFNDYVKDTPLRQDLSIYGMRCIPFRSYHVNCSVCVCPASGITNDAHCVKDISCNSQTYRIDVESNTKKFCIPNVLYMSPCMQCLCSESGHFLLETCIDKCKQPPASQICVPGALYRIGCNICRCPDSGLTDESFCISGTCNKQSNQYLRSLVQLMTRRCTPHSFSVPRCMICDCSSNGVVNESACLELDCVKVNQLSENVVITEKCTPSVMVSICSECFCGWSGQVIEKYCSRVCSYQTRLNILEMVVKDTSNNSNLIEKSKIKRIRGNELCIPNTLYIDDGSGRYCLCPENSVADIKFCIAVAEKPKPLNREVYSKNIEVDFNISCEPNTLVDFDCNTCYCNKSGKIDPKWCTNDDCEEKRLIQESHKTYTPAVDALDTCQPGAIKKIQCNYCICSENGNIKVASCTKNDCSEVDQYMYADKLTCEPLAYYEVDCNICYCPRDGIKNVELCTKNLCEKSILRSDSCIPGQLFSDDCNLCVCPPDGSKRGKACTNHDCPKAMSWQFLQSSDSSTENQDQMNSTKSLDHCFHGEEFVKGCNLCACPEQGLKMYATCESILCGDKHRDRDENPDNSTQNINLGKSLFRTRRDAESEGNDCSKYNVSTSALRQECTPGTMYIIRCQECICPYLGNINQFCRPLPKKMFCEQAFPYYNYLPMGRREIKAEVVADKASRSSPRSEMNFEIAVKHENHTEYKCEKPGTILDKCFICECEEGKGNVLIEEHCFKSDAEECADAKPTFLLVNNKKVFE